MLQLGLRHRLLNLSQAAQYLRPLIEARVRREVQPSAVVMALSRFQRSIKETTRRSQEHDFVVSNIFVNSELAAVTFPNTAATRQQIQATYVRVQKSGGYATVTQGVHELTIILSSKEVKALRESATEKPISVTEGIASLGIAFDRKYAQTPGFFYAVFQQLYLQNINIVEIASTSSELVLYLRENDVRLAFDTLFNRFGRGKK